MRLLLLIVLLPLSIGAQNYTSYFTGDTADVSPGYQAGFCLMGGATENDEAMKWFLQRAQGGDVIVLRASGSDGYNDYFFSELGITINSVETLVILNTDGALDPYVLQQVENAEAIWFAGGNQYNYVNYFKDNVMEDLLNAHINNKNAVIGGTSAGMAILGGHYFDAENGTVTTAQALANPYDNRMSLGHNDFLSIPILQNVITDTHYDDPDRRGRHTAFMARIATDTSSKPLGIASEEYTSVCIDENNIARVYGDFPSEQDFAYFIQPNCGSGFEPEVCEANTSLTWLQNSDALRVLKVPGTFEGTIAIDLNDWSPISTESEWKHWTVDTGTFNSDSGEDPECYLLNISEEKLEDVRAFPNPFTDQLFIETNLEITYTLYNMGGKVISIDKAINLHSIDTAHLLKGIYFLSVEDSQGNKSLIKLVK